MEVDETAKPGGRLKGRLKNVRMVEVRRDPMTDEWKVAPKGKTWCVGGYEFDHEVPEVPETAGQCVADGTGDRLGENIRDFTLKNCFEEEVSLHSRCGMSKALVLAVVAGWCGACTNFVSNTLSPKYAELSADGFDAMVVIGEDDVGNPPTFKYCKDYANSHGMDPALVYVDGPPLGGTVFTAMDNYSGSSLGLPWDAVLDPRTMEYRWASPAASGGMWEVVDELMSQDF